MFSSTSWRRIIEEPEHQRDPDNDSDSNSDHIDVLTTCINMQLLKAAPVLRT